MQCTWLGHSCVLLRGTKKVLIDPFVPEASVISTNPGIVAVTHGHPDHLGEVIALKKPVVAISEIARYLKGQGVSAEGMNLGGTITLDGVSFTMTPGRCIQPGSIRQQAVFLGSGSGLRDPDGRCFGIPRR